MKTLSKLTIRTLLFVAALASANVHAALTDISDSPLAATGRHSVKPNLMFILDDSGSMSWTYMPDDADNFRGKYGYLSSQCNGVYYDPTITYAPPTDSTGTSYSDSSFTAAPDDGYNASSTARNLNSQFIANRFVPDSANSTYTSNGSYLGNSGANSLGPYGAFYYIYSGSQTTSDYYDTSSTFYKECNNTINSATITVSGTGSTSVSSITINGVELMSGTSTASSSTSTVATNIAAKISKNGYSASASGSTITINGPYLTAAPVITATTGSGMTLTPSTRFSKVRLASTETTTITISSTSSATVDSIIVNGIELMGATSVAGGTNTSTTAGNIAARMYKASAAGYTATSSGNVITITGPSSAANYIPAVHVNAGSMTFTTDVFPDTDAGHLTNFANWYTYYRARMLMMKSAAGLAFKSILSSYRVGFSTISYTGVDSTKSSFLKISDFDSPQRASWYSKLYATIASSSTPLRSALTKAGRLYAGQLLTGADDPMQYSCQQNFTILSTDGYWNDTSNPKRIDGRTDIGQQDGDEPRPMNDGGSTTYTKTTSQILQSQTQTTKNTSQWLQRTTQLQRQSPVIQEVQAQLYTRTSSNFGTSWGDWSATNTCNEDSSGSGQRQCIVGTLETRTSNNNGSTWTDWTATSSCRSSSNRQCQVTQYWVTTASCTPSHTGSSGAYRWSGGSTAVDCQNAIDWTNVAACTGTCRTLYNGDPSDCAAAGTINYGGQCYVGVSSCSAPGTNSTGQTVTCSSPDPIVTGPDPVASSSCSPQTGDSTNNWMTITCSSTVIQNSVPVASCTAGTQATSPYTTTTCNSTSNSVTATSCTPASPTAANNWTTTTCTSTTTGGIPNTLADVAEYYWRTDLRTDALGNCTGALGTDVCENNVPGAGADINTQQHMTTFTVGLGANGLVNYVDGYNDKPRTDPDYYAIVNGTLNWPDPISNTGPERIDDLWHAAVNGRGVYYSAKNAKTLVAGLSSALAGVSARTAAAAAAATSSLEPVAGDNALFIAQYETGTWTGQLIAKTIIITTDPLTNKTTGTISQDPVWSAQSLLDTMTSSGSDSRNIYVFDSSATNKLKPFLWGSLSSTEQAYFNNICSPTVQLSQCPSLSATDQAAASGANLVNYLRGQTGNEGTLYRTRKHILGDIVDAQPQYVKAPPYNYVDPGYTDFQAAQAGRAPMVYAAANDGMLHAFDASTGQSTSGQEMWAYIPPMVMSNLYRLADESYSANHRFYVDGSPIAGDICPLAPASDCTASDWKTILVGGLNAGGRGYYALDITDPAHPKALWNFSQSDDGDLGYTFGNPIIVKRKDGTWVVVVTSGYNNVSPGDGNGHLFVLNANTGQLLEKIDTNDANGHAVGDTSSPNGLSRINSWINDSTDKTAQRFYGGDMLGDLWRFTLDSDTPPASPVSTAGTALLLAKVGQINGAGVQPITTKPELTVVPFAGTNYNVVEFGTGKYLGQGDLQDTSQQSVYAIKDNLGDTGLGLVRTTGVLVQQVLTNVPGVNGAQDTRTVTNNPVDWSKVNGWYVDLNPGNTSPGERVNIDVQLNLGLLTVAANVPTDNACDVSGQAYLYYFDFMSGAAASTATNNEVGQKDTENAMVAGMNFVYIQDQNGTWQGMNIVCTTDASCHVTIPPPPPPPSPNAKRFSWRELVQ